MAGPENPPAFPPSITVTAAGDVYHGFDGMTLRDWFAGQVLYGLHGLPIDELEANSVARRCYMTADALLAARQTTDRENGK